MYRLLTFSLVLLALLKSSTAYWLMGAKNLLTIERIDPIVNPGAVSGHVHAVLGGSNFRFNTSTDNLRNSLCTSIPIIEDKSNYWFPHLYFQWSNGSFTSLTGGAVIYYLFSDQPGTTTAFPDNFRMISGDMTLREYDPTSFAQQAVTFLCLDFNGVSTRYNSLPPTTCPNGIRAQINFPSCWDGKNIDSANHKSHVSFLSTGPDSGTCTDPNFPVTLPRIFIEMYWGSQSFDGVRSQAMNSTQPFVYSYGDATGYGYHADFINGWEDGVLQKAVDQCHCNIYGDPTCCGDAGIFTLDSSQECHITKSVDEVVEGTLPLLPGNNPVQGGVQHVPVLTDPVTPPIISPVCAYTGTVPPATCGTVATPAVTAGTVATSATTTSSSMPSAAAAGVVAPLSPSSSGVTSAAAGKVVLPVSPATTTATTTTTSSSSTTPAPPSVPVNKGAAGGNPSASTTSSASATPTPPSVPANQGAAGGSGEEPSAPTTSSASATPTPPSVPVNQGAAGGSVEEPSASSSTPSRAAPVSSPTPSHAAPPPHNSTGSHDDDDDDDEECSRKKPKKKDNKKKPWHRPHSRDISRRFGNAF